MILIDSSAKMTGPILEMSPLISHQEIMYLISNGLCTAGLCAIARRTDLSSKDIEALIETKDADVHEVIRNNECAS